MRAAIPRRPAICSRCLLSIRRAYSSALPSPPPTSAITRLSNRRLISLHGADAPKFLQGLTTNNLHPSWTSGWYSAFLTAQGRVLWDVFIYPTSWSRRYKDWLDSSGTGKGRDDGDWSCFIEVDANEIESLVKHLKRHKLRSKVTIRIVEEGEWEVFAAWNDSKPPSSNSSIQAVPDPSEQITFTDPRVPNFGHRILLSAPSSASKEEALARSHLPESLPESELSYYTLRRYLHGIPEGQAEIIREQALPQESDIDFMNGIDFRKGCYVGQELTIRTHHTGVVRKRILPVQLYRTGNGMPERLEYDKDWMGGVPAAGTNIKKVEGKGRSTGKFLAGIGNVGLALCRLEMMTDVRLTAEGGTYKEGDEFAVEVQKGGKETRIKPFVPVWMRDKLHMRDAPRRVE